ncbi:MAG: Lrp/AsnC family transcriptional regulator [Marmoricola sp.]
MTLHETDIELVEALREDGRASYETLGARVGLSRKAVRPRVARLFEDGILRVVATVPPEYDNIHVIAHLSVTVSGARREDLARELAELPDSVFVSIVSGQPDVVAEIRTNDLKRLAAIVDQLRTRAGVAHVEPLVYAEVLKEPHLPSPPTADQPPHPLDDVDRTLISLLRHDGRASYSDLAGHVGLSAAATRARVRNLLDNGVILIVALVNPTKLGRSAMTGFAIDLAGPASAVLPRLQEMAAVDFLARTLGGADAVGTILTTTVDDTIEALDRISAMSGVVSVRSWTHLRLVQERYGRAGD